MEFDVFNSRRKAELQSALAIARRRKLASDQQIHAAISRAPYAKGVATLRALLAEGKHPRLTATALQTVGSKGYDGFAIALVNS